MAADIILTADTGRPIGTRTSRRMRAEGRIPAVVYGAGTEPTSISVDWRDLRAALTTDAGLNALITLDVEGTEKLTLVKEMQRHPIRRDVLHVDFIVVDRDTAVEVEVPLTLVGADGDHLKGLVIDQVLYHLTVSAKPGSIPNEIEVDLAELSDAHPVTVGQLTLPDGVEAIAEPDVPVVAASQPMSEAEAAGEVEVEEGEEAEGEAADEASDAEGDGDAGGDDASSDEG